MLIGDSGSGKTSLMLKYTSDTFSPTFITTIGIDFKIKHIEIDKKRIKLQIWDTAGQERFRTITNSYYRGSSGIIITYDVTNMESFKNVQSWINDIGLYANLNIVKILVGNKCDMIDQRVVTTKQAQEFAQKHNMHFFETSAKTGINVNDVFETIANGVYIMLKEKEKKNEKDISTIKIPTNNSSINPKRCC